MLGIPSTARPPPPARSARCPPARTLVHHVLAYTCLARLYVQSVPQTRHVIWYPLAGLVLDVILYRAIRMCWTGQVTWRGTAYTEKPAA